MSASCPICERQALAPVRASDVEVLSCPGCGGLWFDKGQLELFPQRPSTEHFRSAALHAPNRCRKGGHPLGRALQRCAACGGPPAPCPRCGSRLAMVPTPVCAVDVCTQCGGLWLDAGEFELLANLPPEAPARATPAAAPRPASGWEVPAPAAPEPDAWRAPGQAEPVSQRSGTSGQPFTCRHCGAGLAVYQAWAFNGDTFCAGCRPGGAVSGHELPADLLSPGWTKHRRFGWWADLLGPLVQVWWSTR